MTEPPYGEIVDLLKAGRVVPFLGAGASLVARPSNAAWDADSGAFPPNGAELSQFLATKANFPSAEQAERDDLAKVSSYFVEVAGRRRLRERLRQLLNHQYPYGSVHRVLASLRTPMLIVVTNYDRLMEQALQDAKQPFDLVVHPIDRKDKDNIVEWWPDGAREPIDVEPGALDIDFTKKTVIYKMHGTINVASDKRDNFVITEEDYIDFLSRMTLHTAVPSRFMDTFRERSFLFLGYSLRDWNMRIVLKNLSRDLRTRATAAADGFDDSPPSWAIQRQTSDLERQLWRARNVQIYDVDLEAFGASLQSMIGA